MCMQITMTTCRLLLLLIVCSQSVDSQSTTDNETISEEAPQSDLQRDIEKVLDNQQQMYRAIMSRLGKSQHMLPTKHLKHLPGRAHAFVEGSTTPIW